jgi:potassium channel subfamily K
VQQKAAYDNSIIALSLSLGVFSFIWFIGSVVFWQSELGTQNWSYFESLYFTYVSFLTIGYGDFEVTSNAGKPAFVLWALLALPTLTVLIGAIGNTIGETVNTATLWIADHLSEATPGLRLLKHSAQKVKKGGNEGADDGGDHSAAKPAGFMEPDSKASSETDKNDDATDPTTAATTNTDAASALANSAHKPASSNITTDTQPPITRQTSTNPQTGAEDASQTDGIPTTPRTLLLLNELRTVLPHLDASPPRKYSYAEWVYILALLGSDENSPEHHRSADEVRADEKRGIEGKSDSGDGGDENGRGDDEGASGDVPDVAGEKWSWLGRRSPLMSGMDEPRWVLEHIMRAMEKELRGMPGGSEERAKEEVRKTE